MQNAEASLFQDIAHAPMSTCLFSWPSLRYMHRVCPLSFSGLDIRSSFCSLIYCLSRYIYMRTNCSYIVRTSTFWHFVKEYIQEYFYSSINKLNYSNGFVSVSITLYHPWRNFSTNGSMVDDVGVWSILFIFYLISINLHLSERIIFIFSNR